MVGLKTGDIIDAKYRVERVLGKGGMGVIVEATHLTLGTLAAIKVLRRLSTSDPTVMERLVREAQLAARLKGEHIVRVFDVGLLDAGSPYVVMEHLEGCTLQEFIAKNGPLSTPRAVSFILQVCEALEEAHALGIVHRDLKPANLFIVRQRNGTESVKVLDFGIAKLLDTGAPANTRTGAIVGTPQYMAPEQFDAPARVSPAGDIWSLGVILYEILCGKRPFEGNNPIEIIWRVTSSPPAQLANVPPGLDVVVRSCLTRDATERPANVATLIRALIPYAASDCPIATRYRAMAPTSVIPASATVSSQLPMAFTSAPTISSAPTVPAAPRPRGRRLLALSSAVLVLSMGVLGFAVRQHGVSFANAAELAPRAAPTPQPATPQPASPASKTVVLRGSTTVGELSTPITTALAAAHPNVTLRFEPSSSAAGLGALVRGEVEMAGASRQASPAELENAKQANTELVEHVIARDGIAVIVHPDNPVQALSIDQLRAVLTGKTTSWSAVGGRKAKINVLVRPEEQGSHEFIKEAVFRPGDDYPRSAEIVRRSEDVVERVRNDPNAIGYVTFLLTGSTKALKLHEHGAQAVPPSAATIRDGSYPLRRELFIYTRPDASAESREALAFLLGPGQAVVREAGLVPAH